MRICDISVVLGCCPQSYKMRFSVELGLRSNHMHLYRGAYSLRAVAVWWFVVVCAFIIQMTPRAP